MGHIPTKLQRFPTSSFRDLLWTDRLTDTAKTVHAGSIDGAQLIIGNTVTDHAVERSISMTSDKPHTSTNWLDVTIRWRVLVKVR